MKNFPAFLLLEQAARWPHKTALRCRSKGLTYAELAQKAGALGNLMRQRGIEPGQRIMLAMPNCFTCFAVFLGCGAAGISTVLLNDMLLLGDYADCIVDCGPRLAVGAPGHPSLEAARQAGVPVLVLDDHTLDNVLAGLDTQLSPPPCTGQEECIVFATSGTTGHPKCIPHCHDDFFTVADSTGQDFLGYRQDDIALCSAKIHHAYGMLASLTNPLSVGATVVLDPDKPSPAGTVDMVEREGVTILASTPVFYGMLLMGLDDPGRLKSLRLCVSAGETLHEAVFHAWKEKTGLDIWQGYGSTETITTVLGNYPPRIVPGAAGRPLKHYEVAVLDADHHPVADGEPGEIAVRGPSVMKGYLNAPEWSAKVFTLDGWLLTGDMGRREDGVFTVMGRKDDMFKAGGLWISPTRVESALLSHPAVAQCAVTGGAVGSFTLVRAHVVMVPGREEDDALRAELMDHAGKSLPEFMVPTEVIFLDALPMTASGKVQRYKLRRRDG